MDRLDATTSKEAAAEVGKVLDALTTLSYDIECHAGPPDDKLVLPAQRIRESCAAIRDAVAALKKILVITERHGGGVIPPEMMRRLNRKGNKPRPDE